MPLLQLTFGYSSVQTCLTLAHPGHATPRLTQVHLQPSLSRLISAQLTSVASLRHSSPQPFHFGTAHLISAPQQLLHACITTKVAPTQYRHCPLVRRLYLCCIRLPGLSFSFRSALTTRTSTIFNITLLDTRTSMHSSSLPAHHLAPSFTLFTGGGGGGGVVWWTVFYDFKFVLTAMLIVLYIHTHNNRPHVSLSTCLLFCLVLVLLLFTCMTLYD